MMMMARSSRRKSRISDAAGTPGLAQEEDAASPALRIDWKEFRRLYDAKAIELVDVREPVPFESGHIPGARSIPLGEIEKNVAALRKVKKPIVLYCACPSEHSAALAAITLRKAGLDARALIGGYEKWRDEGGKVETGK